MFSLELNREKRELAVLCLGAHCDDIEIGCGGTLLRLCSDNIIKQVKWIVFTSDTIRADEAKRSAHCFLQKVPSKEIVVRQFRDGFLPQSSADVKEYFEEIRSSFQPDIIFTHYRDDLHQDHRTVSSLTWNTFRDHLILEYEIPKYDGDLGNPNCFVPLEAAIAKRKAQSIVTFYPSQAHKHWFDEDTFLSMMRIRGVGAANGGYAESFYVRKFVI